MSKEINNQEGQSNELYTLLECVFCNGTGLAKCFDFDKNKDLPDGTYDLNELTKTKGTYEACPEGCRVMN